MSDETPEVEAELEPQPKKKPRPYHRKKRRKNAPLTVQETAKVLELAVKKVPNVLIAQHLNINASSVARALEKFAPMFKELENVELYKDVRGSLLNATELQLLKSIADEDSIKKASLNNRAYAFKEIHNAQRLEHGKSTSNIESKTSIYTEVRLSDFSDGDKDK